MPIPLRTDFNADNCRLAAKKTKDGPQARRLLALAAIYEGASRSEAARIGGVTLQIARIPTPSTAGILDPAIRCSPLPVRLRG